MTPDRDVGPPRLLRRAAAMGSLGVPLLLTATAAVGAPSEAAAEGLPSNVLYITSLELLLLILLLVWYLLLARRRELDSTVRLPFASFCQGLEGLRTRLEALARRLRALPLAASGSAPLAGRTLDAYQTIDALLAGVARSWLEMMEVRRQIDTTLSARTLLRAPALARLREQLNARESLDQGASDLTTCEEALHELEHAPEEARAMVEAIGNLYESAQHNLRDLEAGGLPMGPYEDERRAIEEGLDHAAAVLEADPLGADQALQDLQAAAAALSARTARALDHRRGAEESWRKLEEVANQAITLRKDGLLLAEDEANPDGPLRQSRWEHEAARLALERGEMELAERHLELSFSWSEKARLGMERHVAAREHCLQALVELNARAERYAAEVEQAKPWQAELSREHHANGWSGVARHVERAEALFAACRPLMQQAEECLDPARQHYFRAEDLIVHMNRQMDCGEHMMAGLKRDLLRLRGLREGLTRGAEEIESLQARALEAAGQGRNLLTDATRRLLEEAQSAWKEVRVAMSRPQPDWQDLDARARRALAAFRDGLDRVGEEVRAHDEAHALMACLREQEGEVGAMLHRHHEANPRASALYDQTRAEFEAVQKDIAQPQTDWRETVARLTALHDQFQRAGRWIHEDADIACQAARELGEAEETLRAAQCSCPWGMAGNGTAAAELIEAARRLLANRNYAEALQRAVSAGAEARQAQQRALRDVRDRQARLRRPRAQFSFETQPAEAPMKAPAAPAEPSGEPGRLFEGRPTFPSRGWSAADATATTEWAPSPAAAAEPADRVKPA